MHKVANHIVQFPQKKIENECMLQGRFHDLSGYWIGNYGELMIGKL